MRYTVFAWLVGLAAALTLAVPSTAEAVTGVAPGAPGARALWTAGNKDGFGTSTTLSSKVWYTLNSGELTEVYYPDLGTPAVRDLQFIVTDGKSWVERETDGTDHTLKLTDPRSLSYEQINTDPRGRFRIIKTYTTDPSRSVLLMRVHFESMTSEPLHLYVYYDPSLSGNGDDDSGTTVGNALTASDSKSASALVSSPAFTKTSSGYLGTSDGWTDLSSHDTMDWTYTSAPNGNVVQTAAMPLTGKPGVQDATIALGFAGSGSAALANANAAMAGGFARSQRAYQSGWHRYLAGHPRPRSVAGHEELYDVSLMVLGASEDKTYRGAFIASPTMAWVWGQLPGYNGPYHLVWSRDLYEMATAEIAAGYRGAAERALSFIWTRQQEPSGCVPQNSHVDGTPEWTGLQLDEVADPILLAWQLGHTDADTWAHVQRAVGCILANGPVTQERWENEIGYSPASIATEIAGLVCAAQIAQDNGDATDAANYRATADSWRSQLDHWTVTTDGPLSPSPYFLRLSVDGNANAGTTYQLSDGGPTVDQRTVVDPSFLELVRLGVLRADNPTILSTLPVVDRELGVETPNGEFWHRYNYDGYGESLTGGPFGNNDGVGRLWPIFAGERGEYELAAGELSGDVSAARAAAMKRLDAMANTANDGLMLPEQVWDDNPPSGTDGRAPGTGTGSATPLGWTHAQFIRLAWSIDAGRPVEQLSLVSCRYGGTCPAGAR
ncbi:MAG TPA: glycoside hydrolase family 15 protein [Solirubrobacteraceae bacterium]|nr:glycoside hydrolase family 15 protein [Solirubrobacteraceae bacterium]